MRGFARSRQCQQGLTEPLASAGGDGASRLCPTLRSLPQRWPWRDEFVLLAQDAKGDRARRIYDQLPDASKDPDGLVGDYAGRLDTIGEPQDEIVTVGHPHFRKRRGVHLIVVADQPVLRQEIGDERVDLMIGE
jgi:hypothetical protein